MRSCKCVVMALLLAAMSLMPLSASAQHGGDSSDLGGTSSTMDLSAQEAAENKAEAIQADRAAESLAENFEDYATQWSDSGCEDKAVQAKRVCDDTAKKAADSLKKLEEHIAATISMYEQSIDKYAKTHNHQMRRYMQRKLSSIKEYREEVHKTALYSYLKETKLIQ